MPSHLRTRALVPVLAWLLLLTGCTSLSSAGEKGYVTGDGQVTVLAPEDRGEPIELDGEDLEGEPLSLADYRGQVVVVNVWGSWCVDCRVEMPDLLEAVEQTKGKATFVGINTRDTDPAPAQAFVRNVGMPYPSFYSPDGKATLPFNETLPPRAIPSTLVLDTQGRVAGSIIGRLPSALTLVDVVEEVAAGEPSGG